METKDLIQKELQSFAEQFTQSIIAQFQRCLVPIEEKLENFERNEGKLIEIEGQIAKMHDKQSDAEHFPLSIMPRESAESATFSNQELEDLWISHRIHEAEENFSTSEQQEEQENELENYSNVDENESLDPGGCQSHFSETSENSADE
jgi:hypothetical protein